MGVHAYDVQCVCAGARFHYSKCLCMLIQLRKMLEIHGCRCQGLWPAAADEILSGSTDLCSITKSLTDVIFNCDEETMRFLDKMYKHCIKMPTCIKHMTTHLFSAQVSPSFNSVTLNLKFGFLSV